MSEIKQDIREPTFIVAANDSVHKNMADYVCDGVNDHVEIQAALDALPATGGEVKLLDGTYNCEATINLDSNQTLRGCGRNTILTTSTADLIFLSAVGGLGTELTGIVIADLQIDGGAGAVSDCGIYFEYVDYSYIQNVYSRRHDSGTGSYISGVYLLNSDCNTITGNTCQGNSNGLHLSTSNNNTVTSNICQGNSSSGIYLYTSNNNTITGNTYQGNSNGIEISASNNNTITGNTCQGNSSNGIYLEVSNNNTITGNTCQGNSVNGIYLDISRNNTVMGNTYLENSQLLTNTYDDIFVDNGSDYNNIQGNTCRAGGLAAVPRYGININSADCDDNLVANNDLLDDGFGTGSFNDSGTNTIVRENRGFVTENRGTATILAAQTSIAVNHGLDKTPVAGDVIVTPAETLGLASEFWVDTYTPAQFTIHVDLAPGADTDFVWQARVL